MRKQMRQAFCAVFLLMALESAAQTRGATNDFSITLERIGCLGSCPDYTITILADGSVQFEGRAYVRAEGVHKATISTSAVRKLITRLRSENFFQWEEKKEVCVDFAEIHITASLNGQNKQVLEGCNSPGKVLRLADEIDRISGARRWIGTGK